MKPRFSIVVPTYKRPELLHRSLRHILAQDYDNYEVIVVNDGGDDAAEKVVAEFASPLVMYHWKPNEQKGIAKNYGFDRATGDYLCSFDDDDIMYPNHLRAAAEVAMREHQPPVFCTHFEMCDLEGRPRREVPRPRGSVRQGLMARNFLSNNGVFLRKDVAAKYRYLADRNLTLSSDWLLWLKIASEHEFIYDATVTHGVCEHADRGTAAGNPAQYERNRLIFIRELERFYETVPGADRSFIRKINAHYHTYVALFLGLTGRRREAIRHLLQGLLQNPGELASKRAAVILLCLAGLKGGSRK